MNTTLHWLQTRVVDGDIEKLSETELLSLVLSDDEAAQAILRDFGGFRGLAYQPLEKFLRYKGIGDAKIIRLAACFEMARRVVEQVIQQQQSRLL